MRKLIACAKKLFCNKNTLRIAFIILLFALSVVVENWFIGNKSIAFSVENVPGVVFSAVATISAIWTTYYFLFFQLYKDKYPLHLAQNRTQPRMRFLFFCIVFSLIVGIAVLVMKNSFLPTLFYICFSVYTIIRIFVEVYHVNKSLMVNTYVDEYCLEIKQRMNFEKEVPDKSVWKDVAYIFDESITKEEYLVAQNITDNLGDIFREFMEESISIAGKGSDKESINEQFSRIVSFNIGQLLKCKNVKSEMLVQHIVAQNYKNVEFCIKTNQYEWFKQYIEKLNHLVFLLLEDNQERICNTIISFYIEILKQLIEQQKDEWWKYLIDEFYSIIRELNYISENNNLKYFIRILTAGFISCIDNNDEDAFSYLMAMLREFTTSINRIPMAFTDIKVYYAMIFNKIKKDNSSRIEAISDLVFSKEVSMQGDEYWLEFKFYCINELKELKNDPRLLQKAEQYHILAVINAIDFRDKYQGVIVIPNFTERIKENITSSEKIDEIIEDLKRILNRCVIKDNIPAYNAFLGEIDNCFGITKQSNKLAQEKLFNLYLWLIRRTTSLINQQFLEITFDQIRGTIESLDKKKVVSASFSITIIKGLASAAQSSEKQNKNVVNGIVDLLFDFLAQDTALNFILTSGNAKTQLCRSLFNIGTYCIEENYEEGLRRVSNALGWLAIDSLRQGTSDLTTYILGRAEELYRIAAEMDVSQKTMTFLLTLFTTIGTYCCKDQTLKKYLNIIISSLDRANLQDINTAIRLRTSENDMWNDLFEDRTAELTDKFKKEFSRQSKRKE